MIKHFNTIILSVFVFIIPFHSLAARNIYVEYSEKMADILNNDSETSDFVEQIIGGENIILFDGKNCAEVAFNKGVNRLNSLLGCFADDRLNDKCEANDMLQRAQESFDSSAFNFIKESQARTDIVFTSHDKLLMSNLAANITKYIPAFYLMFLKTKNGNELFYLSSEKLLNDKLLVGMQPFDRNITSFFCSTSCNRKKVDLLKCFQGRNPGFISSIKYLFPQEKLSSNMREYPESCFPPYPCIESIDNMHIPYSETVYYKKLAHCINSVNENDKGSSLENHIGIKVGALFVVYRANPDLFASLPGEVSEILLSIANESEEEYLQPIEQILTMTIKNCQ